MEVVAEGAGGTLAAAYGLDLGRADYCGQQSVASNEPSLQCRSDLGRMSQAESISVRSFASSHKEPGLRLDSMELLFVVRKGNASSAHDIDEDFSLEGLAQQLPTTPYHAFRPIGEAPRLLLGEICLDDAFLGQTFAE
jgi:hypothetical protein